MRLLRNFVQRFSQLIIICVIAPFLAGCLPWGSDNPKDTGPAVDETALRMGEMIKIDFSGTPTPMQSVETEIKGDGTVTLELIGPVKAAGYSPGQLEHIIQSKYVPDYYTHMNVTVTPSARFFYVGGELNGNLGRFPYTGPITVTQAIDSAGGFSPFADKRHVKLYRVGAKTFLRVNCVKALSHPELDLPVYPGDRIFVPRRLY